MPLAATRPMYHFAPTSWRRLPGRLPPSCSRLGACHLPRPGRPDRFGADTGSGSQLYTVRPNGHELGQITHVDGDALFPDWLPDGRRIVFALETEDSSCSSS